MQTRDWARPILLLMSTSVAMKIIVVVVEFLAFLRTYFFMKDLWLFIGDLEGVLLFNQVCLVVVSFLGLSSRGGELVESQLTRDPKIITSPTTWTQRLLNKFWA